MSIPWKPEYRLFRDDANTPEIRENVRKWVQALEEPGRKQTEGWLSAVRGTDLACKGECCLGVGCLVLRIPSKLKGAIRTFLGQEATLPPIAVYQLGLINDYGVYCVVGNEDLAILNDNGHTFSEIAEFIRTAWREQFGEAL